VTLYHAPEPLADHHQVDTFACGVESLDTFLVKRARANEVSGASRTFVATDDGTTVVGYYSHATGAVMRSAMPGSMRRNQPDPLPVMVIGRLAADRRHQGGLGTALLGDALTRIALASAHAGFVAVVTHPVDDDAHAWWLRKGFLEAPAAEPMLYLPLAAVLAELV